MLEKNYTNPDGIGRFSFSESGTFRAPYKNEGIYIVMTILVSVFLEIGVIIFALTFMREFISSLDESAAMFSSIVATAIIGFGSIIIFAVSGTIVSRISGGMDCQYSALEDKFIITIGGDTHVINYAEVQSVVFIPRYFLNKVKGYDVEITIANQVKHYGVSFRGQFQSEKTTPFYIIKERVELIEQRRNDEIALYAQQKIGADKPVSQNEIDRARLRKKASDEVFPPNAGNYKNKMVSVENNSAPTMNSVAPRSVSKPKMAGVSAESESKKTAAASMQMPEIKTVSRSSASVSKENSTENASGKAEMAQIAPLSKRPSSEIFTNNGENQPEIADNSANSSEISAISDDETEIKVSDFDEDNSDLLTVDDFQEDDGEELTVASDDDDELKKKN